MKPYFAYGSNLSIKQMKKRCPECRLLGKAVLDGYRWIISTNGYASIVRSEKDQVHGLIYELSASDEEKLDGYEGVAQGAYRKENIPVKLAFRPLVCLVYIDPVEKEGSPRQEYIKRINAGLADADLPDEYVDRYIRRFIPIDLP